MRDHAESRIVVGLDGSPSSLAALDWAVTEAARRSRPVHLVEALHLSPPVTPVMGDLPPMVLPEPSEVIARGLDHVRTREPALAVTTEVTTGSAAGRLVELSDEADTVVVGSRGRGMLRAALLGSVSFQVATHARCPVVVVREGPASTGRRLGVVVGVDTRESSGEAVGYAFAQASSRGVDLTAVHAWWLTMPDAMPAVMAVDDMASLSQDLVEAVSGWASKYPEVTVHERVMTLPAVEALAQLSEHAELVVVGTRGRGGFTSLMLGSTSYEVAACSLCPTVVVHPDPSRR